MSDHNTREKIHIGNVSGQIGLRGEIKIFHFADNPDALKAFDYLLIDDEEFIIENIRYKKKIPIIKLEGVNDRESAESLYKKEIYRYSDDKADLPADTYYIKDLVGMTAVSAEDGQIIGQVKDVVSGKAQDIYEILCSDGKILPIPAVEDFIAEVNLTEKKMKINLPDGIDELKY